MPCQFIHALHIRFTFLNCVKESDLKNADDLSICSRLIFPFFFVLCYNSEIGLGEGEGGLLCYDEIEKGEMGWVGAGWL